MSATVPDLIKVQPQPESRHNDSVVVREALGVGLNAGLLEVMLDAEVYNRQAGFNKQVMTLKISVEQAQWLMSFIQTGLCEAYGRGWWDGECVD